MNKSICSPQECTACNVCANVCPKQCISIQSDNTELGAFKDDEICINCGLCEKICPSLHKYEGNEPKKAFAAWTKDSNRHRQSASGGVASEIYFYALSQGWSIVGVDFNDSFEAAYKVSSDAKDIVSFQNSKYVYSSPGDIYAQIRKICNEGKRVVFVGLPCHVAAITSFAEKYKFRDLLYLVDLVCHGTPSPVLFKQHIKTLQNKFKEKVTKCFFRDPSYGTEKYFFTLYHKDKKLLKSSVSEDLYCYGYHHSLIYRECCYDCKYAKCERLGDLTLSDYSGLGSVSLYRGNRTKVSCILVNTQRGEELLESLSSTLELHKRPIDEPIRHESMFNLPPRRKQEVEVFKASYAKELDFDKSIQPLVTRLLALKKKAARNPKAITRRFLECVIPYRIKFFIKHFIKK